MAFDIPTDGLDENVLRLGQIIGLIEPDNSVDTSWFGNAGDELKNAFDSERHAALLDLLESLLGSADAQTVGMPNATADAYWYPISYEDGGVKKETGFYITVLQETDALVFGVGAKWEDQPGGTSLDIKLWAHHPLLRVSDSGVDFVMGQTIYPVDIAFEVHDTSPTPTFGTEDLNFDGVRLGAHIFFDQDPDFSFVFLNLKLPDGNPPADRSLLDLSSIGGDEWLNMLVALLTAQLETISSDANVAAIARHLMPLFGFSDDIPNIRWDQLGSGGVVFTNWLRDIAANKTYAQAWLAHLGKLLSANEALSIMGTGSRSDPYRASVDIGGSDVHLDVTLAVVSNSNGTKSLYPGISVRSDVALGSGVLLAIEAVSELLGITIGSTANPAIEGLTAFSVRMRLHRGDGTPLASKTFTGADPIPLNELGTFAVGELRAGLKLNEAHEPSPMLELVNVTCARGSYPVMDLSSGDKMLDVVEQVAGEVAESVVVSLVDELLDQIGGTSGDHPGRHLAALLGLIEPPSYTGNPTPYPVALVTADLPQFLGNPMQAIGCYHSACLETNVDGSPVWRFMLAELSAILRHASIPSLNITGTGSVGDRWQVMIFDETNNRALLEAWTTSASGRNQLRLSLLFEPESAALSGGVFLTALLRIGLLHLDLPDMATCPAPVQTDWLPSVAIAGRISGTSAISTGNLAGVTIEAESVMLGASWEQSTAFGWFAEVTGLTATVSGGTPINLPALSFNPVSPPTLNDIGDFFRLMLGRWLIESGGPSGFGLAGLLGLLPNMPDLTLPSIPDWGTSAYSLPVDWPTLEITDYGAFFANPFPTIRLHIGKLLSNPDWALPALRWLAGTIHGAFPDLSIPELGLPAVPNVSEFPIRGSGTYEDPWAITLVDASEFPFEVLLWLDPDGPAAGSLVNAALSWLPPGLQDLSTLDPSALSESQLVQIMRVLSQVDTSLRDALAAFVDADLIAALEQLNSFLLNSDGFVPVAVQRPAGATTTWDAPQDPASLPVAHHMAQLSNTAILDDIEARINALSTTAPVLLLAAPWSEHDGWTDLVSRFGQSLSTQPDVDFSQAGVDPAFVSVTGVSDVKRFYTAQLNPFNLDPTAASPILPLNASAPQSSITAQVSRMVDRIRELHGNTEQVIIIGHSVSGLAARAAAVNDGDASRIMGVITVGTPHVSIFPPWAVEAFQMDDLISLIQNISGGTLPDTSYTAALSTLYDMMTDAGDLLEFPLHMMDPSAIPLDLPAGVDGLMLATRLSSGISLRSVILDWLQERITALSSAFDSRPPVTHLGFGLRRNGITVDTPAQDVRTVNDVRVDIARVPIVASPVDTSSYVPLPRLSLITHILRPGGWLVGDAVADVRLRWAQVGCRVAPNDIEPIVRLYDTHIDSVTLPRAALTRIPDGSFNAPATMTQLLNALLEKLTQETVIPSPQADELAALLEYLDLTLEEGLGYGVNPDGWTSLLDNPQLYLTNKLNQLLASSDIAAFYEQVLQVFGGAMGDLKRLLVAQVDDTPLVTAVREVLVALDLAENASKGYALKIQAILDLLELDAAALESRLNALLANATTRSQLLQKLRNALGLNDASNPVVEGVVFDMLHVRITSGGQITIRLLTPFILANELTIGFRLQLDLQAATFDMGFTLRYVRIPAGLFIGFERDVTGMFKFNVSLDWDGTGFPAPYAALRLIPPAPDLESRLREILPRFVISSVATLILENEVLRTVPESVNFFTRLGLAYQPTPAALPKLRSLDGLVMKPRDWLLTEAALGTPDGKLSLAKLVNLVNDFGTMTGLRPSGDIELPYGVTVKLTTSGQTAVIEVAIDPALTVADGTTIAPTFNLSLSPTLDVTVGAAIAATLALPPEAGWSALEINLAYTDETFTFALGDGGSTTLQLYPFAGFDPSLLGSIAGDAAFRLLPLLLEATMDAMGDIGGDVQAAANNLIAVKDALGLNTIADFDVLLADPLSWLESKFINSTTATATVNALANLTNGSVNVPGLAFASGMVTYTTNVPAAGTVVISLGYDGGEIMVSAALTGLATGPIIHTVSAEVSVPISLGTPTFGFELLTSVAENVIAPAGVSITPALHFVQSGTAMPDFSIYPFGQGGDTPDFVLQVMPTVSFTCDSGSIDDCLLSLTQTLLVPIICEILIDTDDVTDWLNAELFGAGTAKPGDVLVQAGLLVKVGANYDLVALDSLPFSDGLTFLSRLLGAALNALSGTVLISFPVEVGGGISIETAGNLYGLRVNLPHITVSDDPEIVVLLGSPDSDTDETEWISGASTNPVHAALKPGLTLWLVEITGTGPGMTFNFEPALSIVNFGINISGKADLPLFDIDGFKMDGFEARLLFNITNMTSTVNVDFGMVGELHQLGLPLGAFAGDNAVAQNLLSGGNGGGGDSAAVNPAFNISVGYINQLYVDFDGTTEIWIPIQSGFGPVHILQIGLSWTQSNKTIKLLVDGNVSLAGLTVEFDDLFLAYSLQSKDFSFGLRGLGVSYISDSVKIAGALLETPGGGYAGVVLVEASGRTFSALGAYEQLPGGDPSMFVFVVVSIPLGGPPYFFVLGLAGGFGYNRNLIAPPIEGVNDFPFVAVATGSSAISQPMTMLQTLGQSVPPTSGAYWLAAGLRFNSFALVNSFALLYVLLNEGFELGLLGVASMQLPPVKPLVSIEMALKVRFSTVDGVFSVEAQLTDNSWLLDVSCHLTGGFAFYMWFAGPHQGDFVISLGGYHPRFEKPDHFPIVPRLGFSWRVSSNIVIKGESYFALTNSAVMAGGLLEASYQSGALKAWFKLWADFLIQWKPFFYDIEIGVSVGVSYRLKINLLFGTVTKTFKVELSARLRIWGPKFSGEAEITWWVISFTVRFGANASKEAPLVDWGTFREDFLPETIYYAEIESGLLEEEDPPHWMLKPEFVIKTETAFAANSIQVGDNLDTTTLMGAALLLAILFGLDVSDVAYQHEDLDIRPMGESDMLSIHQIDIRRFGGSSMMVNAAPNLSEDAVFDETRYFDEDGKAYKLMTEVSYLTDQDEKIRFQIVRDFLPGALWDTDIEGADLKKVTVPGIVGLRIIVAVDEQELRDHHATGQIDVKQKDLGPVIHPLPFYQEIPNRFVVGEVAAIANFLQLVDVDITSANLLNTAQYILSSDLWSERRKIVIQMLQAQGAVVDLSTADIATSYTMSRRSAPPQIVSLYEGMAAAVKEEIELVAIVPVVRPPIILSSRVPKLMAVMRQRSEPTRATLPSRRTTVYQVENQRNLNRVAVTSLRETPIAGAKLQRVAHPNAPRMTQVQLSGQTFVNNLNATPVQSQQFTQLQQRAVLQTDALNVNTLRLTDSYYRASNNPLPGVVLSAGTSQVWDVPTRRAVGRLPELLFTGDQALRITALDRSGNLLADVEVFGSGRYEIPLLTARIIVTGFGVPVDRDENLVPAMGAISLNEATKPVAIVGWQNSTQMLQVAHRTLLGRGAVVRTGDVLNSSRNRQRVEQALTTGAAMMRDQEMLETWLPASVNTVGVLVETRNSNTEETAQSMLNLGVTNAVLSTKPTMVMGGSLALFLYGVRDVDDPRAGIRIAATLQSNWTIRGMVGMVGSVAYWTGALATQSLDSLVENGPLTPHGKTRLAFVMPPRNTPDDTDITDVIT